MTLLLLDNYDSFTYNLYQYLCELGAEVIVHRNNKITVDDVAALNPERIVISPGPKTPKEAGISVDLIQRFAGQVPILGVCLGHQSIGQACGATIGSAKHLMHGKTDSIHHDNRGLFTGLENPFIATRYHSLIIEPGTLDDAYEISAWAHAPDGSQEIMGIRHKEHPVIGWQFHPESFLSENGPLLLERFLQL